VAPKNPARGRGDPTVGILQGSPTPLYLLSEGDTSHGNVGYELTVIPKRELRGSNEQKLCLGGASRGKNL